MTIQEEFDEYKKTQESLWKALLDKLDESLDLQSKVIETVKKIVEDSHLTNTLTMVKHKEL